MTDPVDTIMLGLQDWGSTKGKFGIEPAVAKKALDSHYAKLYGGDSGASATSDYETKCKIDRIFFEKYNALHDNILESEFEAAKAASTADVQIMNERISAKVQEAETQAAALFIQNANGHIILTAKAMRDTPLNPVIHSEVMADGSIEYWLKSDPTTP
jgi:hypothetical protein